MAMMAAFPGGGKGSSAAPPQMQHSQPPHIAMAMSAAAGLDPKTEVNQFCQRFCQRPVTKTDIVYVTSKFGHQFGHQFQTIVKLNCVQGQEYAGNLCATPKEAEKSAAMQVLANYEAQIKALPPVNSKETRKKATPFLTPAELAAKKARQAEEGDNPAITPKTELNSLCMRIAKRYLQKGETVYECRKVPGGYQATVKLSALPGDWKDRVWAGEVFTTKQKAEQSAAEIALAQIQGDSEMSEEAAKPKGFGKGKGKGKGWGKGWEWLDWVWEGGSGDGMLRERIDEEIRTGSVVDWKDNYGWIKAHKEVDHEAASMRDGKIYVNKRDAEGTTLEVGMNVKFYVYLDPSGLGAEEVSAQ